MKVSDQTNLSHMAGLPAESVIKVTAIVRMAIGLHTSPRGATPILDANAVILNEGPIPGILPTHIHPRDILAGLNPHPDPVGDADPILTAEPDPDRDLIEGIAIVVGVTTVQDPWTTSTPSEIPSHPGRTDDLSLEPSNIRPIIEAR